MSMRIVKKGLRLQASLESVGTSVGDGAVSWCWQLFLKGSGYSESGGYAGHVG